MVLKRVRSGDQDLIAKVYCQVGVQSILVREGYTSSSPFFGVFEPFNVVEADLEQKGDILVPNDVLSVERLSLLATDCRRYLWMCWLSAFTLSRIRFYDERIFQLLVKFLKVDPGRSAGLYRVLFRLKVIEAMGLRPKFLERIPRRRRLKVKLSDGSAGEEGEVEVPAQVLATLRRISEKGIGRVSVEKGTLKRIEDLLDLYMEYHMR